MEQNTKQIRELTKENTNRRPCDWRQLSYFDSVYRQIQRHRMLMQLLNRFFVLEDAGCEIIRCTVPDMEAAKAIGEIKKRIHIPLVADIHFDYRLAIAAMENGADKIRINPGNIGSDERVRAVVEKAKEYHVPIRVGVNSGSLEKNILKNIMA